MPSSIRLFHARELPVAVPISSSVWRLNNAAELSKIIIHFVTSRSVDRFVNTLRNKVEADVHHPTYIRTVREIGYRFESD